MKSEETKDRMKLFDLTYKVKTLVNKAAPMDTILGQSYLAAIEKTIDDVAEELFDDRRPKIMKALPPKFANVYCSQCGSDFGPGDHGYSACIAHSGVYAP